MTHADYSVVVAGAGPVGAATAALLAAAGAAPAERIALCAPELAQPARRQRELLVTASPASAAEPPALRVAALSPASERSLRRAQVWQRLDASRLAYYERMRVWHESVPHDGPEVLCFDAAELAEPNLGCIVENVAVQRAAIESFRVQGGTLLAQAVEGASAGAEYVELQSAGATLRCQLLVVADGGHSLLRERLGIETQRADYGQRAIVARVQTERPHQSTAWQRFLAAGPVAFLPLFDGSCSIVWAMTRPDAAERLSLGESEFGVALTAATDRVLGRTQLMGERAAFDLQRITAQRLIAPRAVLLGDAAHVVHPLAGQGINLGLLDAAALCATLGAAEGEDFGAARLLRRYEQQRRSHNAATSLAMSAFNAAFSRGAAGGWLAARALGVAAGSALLRRRFAHAAMGLDSLPAALRA